MFAWFRQVSDHRASLTIKEPTMGLFGPKAACPNCGAEVRQPTIDGSDGQA
jgi:hypothetical protein